MCGICGKINIERRRPVERSTLQKMNNLLEHRGPDEEGLYLNQHVGLGHRRLSIIDLAGGSQPIANEDESMMIVFNGEIYNYRPLREELLKKGHRFKTKSDTEVILHLYEDEQERCLQQLWGMFAFAIWDGRRQRLLLARDRTGKKPLYYALRPDSFVFASELKSLLADPDMRPEVEELAIHHYLTYQYVPAPFTIFKGIHKLPAGNYLSFSQGQVKVKRYWRLEYEPKHELSLGEAKEQTLALLDDAVRIRLESEVPLGVFLSGGIDSSAVVALMRRHLTGELKTFSIGFSEEEFNELPYARNIAERFDTAHHEFIVRPKALEVLPRLVWHFDEPYADSSSLPTYYVAQMARQYVTVTLNGDGGDESFCGYTRYLGLQPFATYRYYKLLPAPLRQHLMGPLWERLFQLTPDNALFQKARYLNSLTLMDPETLYGQMMSIFPNHMKPLLYGERMRRFAHAPDSLDIMRQFMDDGNAQTMIDKMTYSDIMTYLAEDLLPKVDRTTMAHSMEARSPFLDHRVIEFAASLRPEIRFKDHILKYLLKHALDSVLPHEILWRKKRGFTLPIARWFKGEVYHFARELLLCPRARQRGFFNPRFIERMLNDHLRGRQAHHHRLWALLCFELWCQTFSDRSDVTSGPLSL